MKLFKTKQNHVLGHVLREFDLVTEQQLDEALRCQTSGDPRPMGVILMDLGHLTAGEVEHALMVQKARRGSLDHKDGVRLLDQAAQATKKAASCIDDLTVAAEELAVKAKG